MDVLAATPAKEITTELCKGKNVAIEKILSMGQTTDWMTQNKNEWVSVISGRAAVGFSDGNSTILNPGDHMLIPAGKTHRVEFTSRPCVWLCVHFE